MFENLNDFLMLCVELERMIYWRFDVSVYKYGTANLRSIDHVTRIASLV